MQDFLNTGTPHTKNITNNNVTVGQDNFGGIWVNLAYLAAVNINTNTVNAAAGVVSGTTLPMASTSPRCDLAQPPL